MSLELWNKREIEIMYKIGSTMLSVKVCLLCFSLLQIMVSIFSTKLVIVALDIGNKFGDGTVSRTNKPE